MSKFIERSEVHPAINNLQDAIDSLRALYFKKAAILQKQSFKNLGNQNDAMIELANIAEVIASVTESRHKL